MMTMSGYLLTNYRNITDFVTDNVTNKKTVTVRVTDKDSLLKNRLKIGEPQFGPQNEP